MERESAERPLRLLAKPPPPEGGGRILDSGDRPRSSAETFASMPRSPLETALAELSRRDLSVAELHLLLARRGFLPDEAEETLARLNAWNLVSDERAALARLRRRTGRNARGDALLRDELIGFGISDEIADAVIAAVFAEEPEADRAVELLRTKYPRGTEAVKAARFLGSRGFGEEAIETALDRGRSEGLFPPDPD